MKRIWPEITYNGFYAIKKTKTNHMYLIHTYFIRSGIKLPTMFDMP